MSDPVSGVFALLFGLFLGAHPGAKPVETPALKPAAATCALRIAKSAGQQFFAATISAAASHAVEGKYALKLKGRGTSSLSIDDTRRFALAAGQTAVLNQLDLDPGVRLSGDLVLTAADGTVICRSSL